MQNTIGVRKGHHQKKLLLQISELQKYEPNKSSRQMWKVIDGREEESEQAKICDFIIQDSHFSDGSWNVMRRCL